MPHTVRIGKTNDSRCFINIINCFFQVQTNSQILCMENI